MAFYKNSLMRYYLNGKWYVEPCEVAIEPDEISIRYRENDKPISYEGRMGKSGLFELHCSQRSGWGSVSLSDDSMYLEGIWEEENEEGETERGSWRIKLRNQSELNVFFDEAFRLGEKLFGHSASLSADEMKTFSHILATFYKIVNEDKCYLDERICKPDTCDFARNGNWVKYNGFECLCDLLYNYVENNKKLVPPKAEYYQGRRRLPGSITN